MRASSRPGALAQKARLGAEARCQAERVAETVVLEAAVVCEDAGAGASEDAGSGAGVAAPSVEQGSIVVEELKGTITVRLRTRAAPWIGTVARLCCTGSSYRICVPQPGSSMASWAVSEDICMNTEGMHSSRPSAKLQIPSDAPARQHGISASTPPPDEVLLTAEVERLSCFLARLREVQKQIKKLKRADPLPPSKRARADPSLPGLTRPSQTPARQASTQQRGGRLASGDTNASKFMAPSLMERKPGLGSGNGPSARKRGGRAIDVPAAAEQPAEPEPIESPAAPSPGGHMQPSSPIQLVCPPPLSPDESVARRSPPLPAAPAPDTALAAASSVVRPGASRGGLVNLGNTCYLNSVLQGLSGCDDFVARVAALSSRRREAGVQEEDGTENDAPLSMRLLPLLLPGRAALSSTLLRQLKRAVSQKRAAFEGAAQQDAHELLCELFGRIEAEAAAANADGGSVGVGCDAREGGIEVVDVEASPAAAATRAHACPVSHTFGFRLRTTLCCDACRHSSAAAEPFSHLSLSLPSDCDEPLPASSSRDVAPEAILQAHAVDDADAAAADDDADLVHVRKPSRPPRPPRPPRQRGRSLVAEAAWARTRSQHSDDEEANFAAAIAASLEPPPPPPLTTQRLLDKFFGEEAREWACGACGHSRAMARTALLDPPETLLLHLSRFEADQASGITHKRCDLVTLDALLRLRHAPPDGDGEGDGDGDGSARVTTFYLHAFVTHHGPKCYSGHYTCVERNGDGSWTEYDDARVTSLDGDPATLEEHMRGAYLLFYKRA